MSERKYKTSDLKGQILDGLRVDAWDEKCKITLNGMIRKQTIEVNKLKNALVEPKEALRLMMLLRLELSS